MSIHLALGVYYSMVTQRFLLFGFLSHVVSGGASAKNTIKSTLSL